MASAQSTAESHKAAQAEKELKIVELQQMIADQARKNSELRARLGEQEEGDVELKTGGKIVESWRSTNRKSQVYWNHVEETLKFTVGG